MSVNFAASLAPLVAGTVCWMLSGSPLPMVFGTAAILSGRSLRLLPGARIRAQASLVLAALAALAVWVHFGLFRSGLAMATAADLPLSLHLSLGLLWVASLLAGPGQTSTGSVALPVGLAGSALFLGASLSVELYDFSEWQTAPLAALPFVLFALVLVGTPSRPATTVVAAIGSAVLVALTGIAMTRGTESVARWVHASGDGEDGGATLSRPSLDAGTGAPDGSSRRLPRKVDIRYNDQVRLYLRAASPGLFEEWATGPLYLRTSAVSVFESDESIAPVRSGRWFYDSDDGESDQRVLLSPGTQRSATQPSSVGVYTLFIDRAAAHALPLPARTDSLLLPAVYEFADGWFQISPREDQPRVRYVGTANLAPVSAEGLLSDFRQPDRNGLYLNLPPSPLAAKVTHLAGAFEPGTSLSTVRDFLRNRASYSLDYETPEDLSPVENLLFGERVGHCELYAAAAVMLLRAADVPCRLAYGYSGGLADPATGTIAFRDRDFHAWAEVLTPDRRWAVFDATPLGESRGGRAPVAGSFSLPDTAAYADLSAVAATDHGGGRPFAEAFLAFTALLSRHFLLLTGGGFLLAGALWWWRGRRGQAASVAPCFTTETSRSVESRITTELAACGALLGKTREPGTTWREFLARLREVSELPSDFDDAVSYHYGIRYASASAEPEREERLATSLRRWREMAAFD